MYQSGIYVEILVNDRPIREYSHQGRIYIEGRHGHNYVINVRNGTAIRKKVVISVDGINITTGDNKWETGYCLNGYESIKIPGFLKNDEKGAKFMFGTMEDSYNQHSDAGQASSIGVIGIRVHNEKPKPVIKRDDWHKPIHHYHSDSPWGYAKGGGYLDCRSRGLGAAPHYEAASKGINMAASSLESMQMSYNATRGIPIASQAYAEERASAGPMGTVWGDEVDFKTREVHYDFHDSYETLAIIYDSRERLRRRGINLDEYAQAIVEPNPFPSVGCPEPKRR